MEKTSSLLNSFNLCFQVPICRGQNEQRIQLCKGNNNNSYNNNSNCQSLPEIQTKLEIFDHSKIQFTEEKLNLH